MDALKLNNIVVIITGWYQKNWFSFIKRCVYERRLRERDIYSIHVLYLGFFFILWEFFESWHIRTKNIQSQVWRFKQKKIQRTAFNG